MSPFLNIYNTNATVTKLAGKVTNVDNKMHCLSGSHYDGSDDSFLCQRSQFFLQRLSMDGIVHVEGDIFLSSMSCNCLVTERAPM